MRCSKIILVRKLLLLGIFALFASTANAFDLSTQGAMVPVFEPDYTTTWDGGTIHTDNNGIAPNVVDWDGDGVEDLLVGVFYDGNIYFYKNYGTNANREFRDRVMLKADGEFISLTSG
jgi:hypothetical protein